MRYRAQIVQRRKVGIVVEADTPGEAVKKAEGIAAKLGRSWDRLRIENECVEIHEEESK